MHKIKLDDKVNATRKVHQSTCPLHNPFLPTLQPVTWSSKLPVHQIVAIFLTSRFRVYFGSPNPGILKERLKNQLRCRLPNIIEQLLRTGIWVFTHSKLELCIFQGHWRSHRRRIWVFYSFYKEFLCNSAFVQFGPLQICEIVKGVWRLSYVAGCKRWKLSASAWRPVQLIVPLPSALLQTWSPLVAPQSPGMYLILVK